MKILVRLVALLLLLLGWQITEAASITSMVGDNFYSPQTVTIHPGDVVTWQYQGGTNSHPTASDNNAWTTFTINSANTTQALTFSTVGSFPYHCNFHGAPGVGMYGVITVATALPTLPAQTLAAALQVYPNPATDVVTLKLGSAQLPDAATVQLLDGLGRVVRTLEVSPALTERELTISVADLPAGLYCYRLLAGGAQVSTQRLTLLR